MNILPQKLVLTRMLRNKIRTFLKVVPSGLHYEKIKRRERKPKNKILVPHLEDTVGAKMWCRQRGLQCTITRLRVVPHFSSGIVERAKRERAWKSPHARKGDTRRGAFFSLSAVCYYVVSILKKRLLEINKPLFNMSFRSPLTQKSATSLDSATILSIVPPFWPNFMDIKLSGECFFKNPWKRSLTLSPESTSVILSIATNTQKKNQRTIRGD